MTIKEFLKEYARANSIANINDYCITISLWDDVEGKYYYSGKLKNIQLNNTINTYDERENKKEEYLHLYINNY